MKDNNQYGLPKLRKYPMPDKKHVKSAIRFFNYVSPTNEKELAKAILKRMRKYGMSFSDFTVGEENRFIKYIPKKYLSHSEDQTMYSNNDFRYYKGGEYLAHYGKKGMKWGKHVQASTQYWLTDQQAANINAANSNLSDQQRRNINAARPTNPAAQRNGASTLSDQQAKNGAATRSTLSDQQQKNINAPKTEAKSNADKEKVDKLVESVINGNYGNGEERKKRLAKEGYDYAEIQNLVNEKLGSSKRHESEKSKSSESKSMSKSERSARASEASARSKMAKNSQRRSSAHSTLSDQQAKNGAAARSTLSDQQQKNINARRTEAVLRSLDARKKQNSRKRKSVKYNYTRANSNYEEIMSGRKLINRLAR